MIYWSHLQVRGVAFLPVVHEDKIQLFQTVFRPQLRDHLIGWVHDELHLENAQHGCLKGIILSPYSAHEINK